MRKSIKNQDNLQRKSQDSKLQTGTQSPTLQKLSYAHPPQESERCLAESIQKKHPPRNKVENSHHRFTRSVKDLQG